MRLRLDYNTDPPLHKSETGVRTPIILYHFHIDTATKIENRAGRCNTSPLIRQSHRLPGSHSPRMISPLPRQKIHHFLPAADRRGLVYAHSDPCKLHRPPPDDPLPRLPWIPPHPVVVVAPPTPKPRGISPHGIAKRTPQHLQEVEKRDVL